MTAHLTKTEFEAAYAERSGRSVKTLRRWRRVYPCNCGEEECEGWQSVNPQSYWEDRIFRESNPLKRFGMWMVLNFWRVWRAR